MNTFKYEKNTLILVNNKLHSDQLRQSINPIFVHSKPYHEFLVLSYTQCCLSSLSGNPKKIP